jgi:hypothetical protein
MVVLAFITDPAVIRKILDHLRLPSIDAPRAPARPSFSLDMPADRVQTQSWGAKPR